MTEVEMEYQKNLKYFKSTDTHYYIGLPMFIIGAALFVLGYVFWMYFLPFQDMIGLVLFVLGAIIAFVPQAKRSSEKDLEEAISLMTKNYVEETTESLGLSSSLLRECPPMLVGTYTFEDGTFVRRGKTDRKCRSNHYTAAALLFTKNGICISEKKFSLTEEKTEETLHEFSYADIDEITTQTGEHRFENGETAKTAALLILASGKTVFSLPVTSNGVLDRALDAVNLYMKRIKTGRK